MKQEDVAEKIANNVGEALSSFYDQILMNTLSHQSSLDEIMNGKIIGYKDKTYIKYLHIPVLNISREYDDDSEYGTGEFEGILLSIKWVKTFIPIGKETIKEPIREKREPKTIKWARYEPITKSRKNKSSDHKIKPITAPIKTKKSR